MKSSFSNFSYVTFYDDFLQYMMDYHLKSNVYNRVLYSAPLDFPHFSYFLIDSRSTEL